ncbi:hypothetical protein VaNZ11_007072 [Volvox africanus]|uniref:EF-hand domain-containing protein n=1 Tax=Volvox africanus TaxID=51714 RepID=A0ABQ5S256_9CHLO|nr:hypothetical protein VaNZ11_007072 [Volvox africanus]
MFVHFRFLRSRTRKRREQESEGLTVGNSNLTPGQIATAEKALRILGLEPRLEQLSKQDFVIFLYAVGLNPTDDIIDSKLRALKLHHKKTFTFGQLAHVWYSMLQDLTDEDEMLKRAFQFFDKDGNGEISVQELRTTMHELGDLLTDEEINAFMEILDVNNDGAVGYTEFLAMLKTQAPDLSNRGKGEEQLQQQRKEGPSESAGLTATSSSSIDGAGPSQSISEPQLLHVPSASDRGITGEGAAAMVSPFAYATAVGGEGVGRTAASGDGAPRNCLAERTQRSVSSMPLPTFPTRRQASLKAGVSPPPPAAPPEPLLQPDASSTLPRPNSRRLVQQSTMSQPFSGSGLLQTSTSEPSGGLARSDGEPLPGSGPGVAADADPLGQGLRAPSALDPGSSSEGT